MRPAPWVPMSIGRAARRRRRAPSPPGRPAPPLPPPRRHGVSGRGPGTRGDVRGWGRGGTPGGGTGTRRGPFPWSRREVWDGRGPGCAHAGMRRAGRRGGDGSGGLCKVRRRLPADPMCLGRRRSGSAEPGTLEGGPRLVTIDPPAPRLRGPADLCRGVQAGGTGLERGLRAGVQTCVRPGEWVQPSQTRMRARLWSGPGVSRLVSPIPGSATLASLPSLTALRICTSMDVFFLMRIFSVTCHFTPMAPASRKRLDASAALSKGSLKKR